MKKQILFVAFAFLMSWSSSFASNNPESDLRKQITNLIRTEVLETLQPEEKAELMIRFTIDKNHQIRVIMVDSSKEEIESIVTNKLDFAVVDVDNIITKLHYNLKIHFVNK